MENLNENPVYSIRTHIANTMASMMIQESSEPTMAQVDKDISSLNTFSVDIMSLEEDENLSEDLSKVSEFVSNCMNDEIEVVSCSSGEEILMDPAPIYSERAARVKFSPLATKYLIMTLDEYTPEEIEETWWTPSQREVLNKTHNKTINRLEAGRKEKKSAPYRGLEKIAIEGYQTSKQAKNAYVDTVMDEMERQWRDSNGSEPLDWGKISSLTQEITAKSAQEAIMIALSDENEARAAYQTIKVKDIQQLERSVSNMSASVDSSDRSDHLILQEKEDEDELDSDEGIGKLGRLASSIRSTKEKGLKTKKKNRTKKIKGLVKKKKTKKGKKQDEEESSSSLFYNECDGDLTEVDFADDLGEKESDFPDLGDDTSKQKNENKRRSSSKNKAGGGDNVAFNTGIVTKKWKKKKKKSQLKKTASPDLLSSGSSRASMESYEENAADVAPTLSSLLETKDFITEPPTTEKKKKKRIVSQFASSNIRRIGTRAAWGTK